MSETPAKKFHVLIVDDTPKNIQVAASILSKQGYQISFDRDGKNALLHTKSANFDLILLDIMMPEMDGYETCRHLKADPDTKEIPVIFLTAKTDTESIVKGFRLGAVDYIAKPFNSEELVARVKNHLELKRAKEDLKELNATKDKFFSIIAHDLKNPFNALIGYSELLIESDTIPEDEKRILRNMNTASRQGYDLLRNLLKWARSQIGHLTCEPRMLNIRSITEEVILLLKNNASGKNIRLTVAIPENTLVYADMDMTMTIIRNLIGNAIKYTPEGGTITADAKDRGNVLEISVSDTGVGIAPEDMKKLFRLDTKHSTPGTAKEQGTGLGLNLCKEFAEKSGGEIGVESEIGKGSRFCFTLPKTTEA